MKKAKKKPADKLTPHQRLTRARKAHAAGGTGKIAGYPVHPAAAELPLMAETELSELAASIKANGQRFPVMLHDGKVIDGRNRLLACELAGVTPRTSELGNTGLVEFIADANLRRRQLKQDQRAAIAARLVRHYKSEAAKTPKPGKKSAPGADSRKAPTVAEVARSHGLGKRTVERALEVEKKSPELLDKVLKGEHTLKEAERHVTRGTNGDGDKNERFTPRWLIEELHRYYKFTVDAAGHAKAPATDVIKLWWGRKENGLEQSWRGKRVWCNPPFDECEAWVEKAVREVKEGGCPLALMLMPAVRTEQDWFQDNIELHRDYYQTWEAAKASNDDVMVTTRFLRGRTRFGYPNDPEGEHSGSPEFGCVLVLFTTEAVQDLRALVGLVELKTDLDPENTLDREPEPGVTVHDQIADHCGAERYPGKKAITCNLPRGHAGDHNCGGPHGHTWVTPVYARKEGECDHFVGLMGEPTRCAYCGVREKDHPRPKKGKSRAEREADESAAWSKELRRCAVPSCSSEAALGEKKCPAHLIIDEEGECGAKGLGGETCIEPRDHKGDMHRAANGQTFITALTEPKKTRRGKEAS